MMSRLVGYVSRAAVYHPDARLLSVDVEDWYNGVLLEIAGRVMPPSDAVRRNTERLLALFEELDAKATWFFLGEVAVAFPDLVKRVVAAGHEIGVHGFHHHQVRALTPDAYREGLGRAKEAVEQVAGQQVIGYRAVDFGANPRTIYALEMVASLGFRYDSSVFPFSGPRYGTGRAPTCPHWIETVAGPLLEIPVTIGRFMGVRLPAAGGGYFRHFPWWYTRLLMSTARRDKRPLVFYFHPHELDSEARLDRIVGVTPDQEAVIRRCFKSQMRNRHQTEAKLRRLLRCGQFETMRTLYEQAICGAEFRSSE